MGKKVFEACTLSQGVNPVCGVDVVETITPDAFRVFSSFNDVDVKVDAIIDFSSPNTLPSLLEYAIKNGIPAVLCSTGYSADDIKKIDEASKKIAIFRSANMSLGANVLIELVKKASLLLPDFDIEIIEKHHNQKVDAPSGTALMMADAVKEMDENKFFVYGREGKVGKRNPREVGIHAVRGGSIVGEHDALFAGLNETVTLTHHATDRSVFANGAVKAAIYIANKPCGKYNMQDLISGK